MDLEARSFQKAKNSVFRLLKLRLYSEYEIQTKLEQKSFSNAIIKATIKYFKQLGLIDDQLFCEKWIASRLLKPYGMGRIRFELKNKGIHPIIIDQEIVKIDTDYDEQDVVVNLAKRRKAKYKGIDKEKIKQRVYGYLNRRGFSPESIIKAINSL